MMTLRRIVDNLPVMAVNCPDKVALICGSEQITYSQFNTILRKRSEELDNSLPKDVRHIIIQNSQDINFIVTYLSAHFINCTAVPVEESMTEDKIKEIDNLLNKCEWERNIADILFTTGTTGDSKGVMVSHKAIVADAENLIESQGFCSDTVFVISGPLNHIGSLSKVWATLYVGGCVYITNGMKDMEAFLAAFDYPSTKLATFLVPASIRMLLAFGQKKLSSYSDKIDFIETGAAPISQIDMEQLCLALPHTRLYNTYASTETGIISTYDYNGEECLAGCLGRPMQHSTFFITKDGNVACKGNTIMSGYVGDPNLTEKVLRNNTIYTNDKGVIDSKGRLLLQGRDGDVINIGGYKINPIEVENVAMSFNGVEDCICVAGSHPILGSVLKLLIVFASDATRDKKTLARYLNGRLERYKIPQIIEVVDTIKRTYNGKLDRKYYR